MGRRSSSERKVIMGLNKDSGTELEVSLLPVFSSSRPTFEMTIDDDTVPGELDQSIPYQLSEPEPEFYEPECAMCPPGFIDPRCPRHGELVAGIA